LSAAGKPRFALTILHKLVALIVALAPRVNAAGSAGLNPALIR
jgi:hypothetical protein